MVVGMAGLGERKRVSVSASILTAHFARSFSDRAPAMFDARVFTADHRFLHGQTCHGEEAWVVAPAAQLDCQPGTFLDDVLLSDPAVP